MSKTLTKESEVKEGIIVLHYTLAALSEKYDVSIPKRLDINKNLIVKTRNKISNPTPLSIINNLESYLGYDESLSQDHDIVETKYILKVKYAECDYLKKNKSSKN